ETIDRAFLEALSRGGVTRLSVGVQTFYAPSRRAVSRNGDEMQLPGQLALASEYFPGALSVDLITGLPHQNEKILLDDIAGVIDFKPAHVSLYALTMASKKSFTAPSTEEADNLWLCGRDALEKSGYCQYEVSNFCLPEKESLHNIRYWRMNNWLALGPSASGTIIDDEKGCGTRYTIPPDTETWLASKGCDFDKKGGFPPLVENLDKLTLLKESLLMGFRCVQGPDKDLFLRRFHVSIDEIIKKTIKKWRGSLNIQHGKIALTKDGLLFLNRFLIDAFEELDADFSPC
ncbi:MAG: coproporphyrinogen III oxidase family protein, partial [Treponema sp.]|nr:coproporphyrinogen III oxidase family protein [Treponema sp.]